MLGALSRRAVLAAGGGLLVSVALRPATAAEGKLPGSLATESLLDAWVRVAPDGAVTVFTGKAELGQGLRTAVLQVAAEQLRMKPERIELVTADTFRTANEGFTAGSHSMQDSATAAAQVRALLEQQAAAEFGVNAATLRVADGTISAPDGRSAGYGALAAKLDLHVAAQPGSPLGDPSSYRLIGTPLPRANIPPMVTGGPAYVQDMRLPGMLHARVVRQPRPGATLAALDTSAAEAVRGVVKIVRDGSFLAVVAEGEWQAIKASRALAAAARWEGGRQFPGPASTPDLMLSLPARDIAVLNQTGPAASPALQLKARYSKPYIMHGSVGPSCALARLADGTMQVWTHSQGVYPLRAALAQLLRMPPDKVRCIHVAGSGCYGHNGADDAAGDAALIARALIGSASAGRPIRVQWMREDEHQHEPYGPAMIAEVKASLDGSGQIVGWDYGVWSNTHSQRPNVGGLMLQNAALPDKLPVPPPAPIPMPEGGGDRNSIPLYTLPNARVVSHFVPEMPLRVSALRSLGAYLNVFAIESFMDELAAAAGADPVEFRLRHLQDERAKAVVSLTAEKFGWAKRPKGSGFAFARYKNLAAYCAVALELSVQKETGRVRIGRVVAAVDSGQPINPDGIRNQIEGAIVQSASWTLYEQVRFDRNRITSADWSGYPVMRFPVVPESVEVHVVPRPPPSPMPSPTRPGPGCATSRSRRRSFHGRRAHEQEELMTGTNELEPPRIYPTLRCRDAEAMISWLKDVLGFAERVVYRGDGMVHHAELSLGSSILMLGQNRDNDYGKLVGDLSGRRTDALYVAVANADALHDKVKAAGAEIEMELHDTDYGSRDFACRDPEGNLWSFGTYWPKTTEKPLEA